MSGNGAVSAGFTLSSLSRKALEPGAVPFACLTCYDATTARWLARSGVPLLLVGDTAAEVVLGLPRTLDMPLEVLVALTAAVKRGAPGCVVMADMPFMSYQADDAEGVRNAGRFVREGLADIVKLEVDASFAPLVSKMTRAGIPVCAHVGSKPQHAALTSGYTSAGRTAEDALRIVDDAVGLERAGARMILVEAVPPEVARRVVESTGVPVIGIGAGPACHGQIIVLHDLLGLSDHPPRFAKPIASMGEALREAGTEWVRRVAARDLGGTAYTFRAGEEEKLARTRTATPQTDRPRR